MSCWVVPSLAAELWQIPLEQLWRRIREGELESKLEDGFTFVDVAPDGPKLIPPSLPPQLRPQTFTKVEDEQPAGDDAINESQEESAPDPIEQPVATNPSVSDHPDDQLDDPTASTDLGDWRAARRRASRLRIPPRRPVPY